ncbi:hypothetical protein [Psychroserpens jangbogonensis]|uniref:hypothetical protein n=1 Tax=Psychroserpens jangbogonensis TaxID=1484460 RepID=UPI00053E529E|nr:hypothetical protein [Psychroserpens jangbogonensis]
MRKFLYILCFGLLLTTCDDGDIFEVTLDFEDTFEQCGNSSLVFYKINESTSETLSIQLTTLTLEDILEVDDDNLYENTLSLASSNAFNYRSYGRIPTSNFFCNDIPPSDLQIEKDEVSISGEVYIKTILVEDDNDGIPTELEDENLDGDNDPDTNPTDTDGDGIYDYLDADDDGDNVLTTSEGVNYTEEDGLINALDTDGDGIPNYLDKDDDGDGVDTRDEENINVNQNPTDDVTDPDFGEADYLNDQVFTTVVATAFRTHTIRMIYTVTALVSEISLPSITQQTLDFGVLVDPGTLDSRVGTPIFN